jgi:hypothetical protein
MDPKEKAFRDAAKAEGYSDSEINAHLASLTKAEEPALSSSKNYEDFANKEMSQARTAASRMKESASDTGSIAPYAIGAGAAAVGGATVYGAKKVYDTLTKKMEDTSPSSPAKPTSSIPQEPTFDWQNFKPNDVMGETSAPEATAPATGKPTIADLQQKLGMNPGATPPAAPVQTAPPSVVNAVTPPVDAAITSDTTAAPVEKAQALVHAPEAPVVPVAPAAPSAPAAPAAIAPPPERTGPLTTASGFPAQEGTGPAKQRIPAEVESMAKIPKGMAFVPGMNLGGTNTARNALGTEGAVALAQQRGVPFGPYAETEQVLKDFNAQRVGPPATRELRKAIGAPMPSNTPALAGKVMKVGGVLGTLMAVSDLANAKSLPEAGSKALEIGSNLLPAPAQAAMFSGNTNAGETEQMAYLRRMQEAKARGAGNRGMAYDPRKPYNPQFMDVGIPPPFTR